jgi:hypothetical protein
MKNNNGGSKIGFCTLLQIAFIVLKLCKVIDWSWVWVLAPTWIPLLLVLFGFTIYTIVLAYRDIKSTRK